MPHGLSPLYVCFVCGNCLNGEDRDACRPRRRTDEAVRNQSVGARAPIDCVAASRQRKARRPEVGDKTPHEILETEPGPVPGRERMHDQHPGLFGTRGFVRDGCPIQAVIAGGRVQRAEDPAEARMDDSAVDQRGIGGQHHHPRRRCCRDAGRDRLIGRAGQRPRHVADAVRRQHLVGPGIDTQPRRPESRRRLPRQPADARHGQLDQALFFVARGDARPHFVFPAVHGDLVPGRMPGQQLVRMQHRRIAFREVSAADPQLIQQLQDAWMPQLRPIRL